MIKREIEFLTHDMCAELAPNVRKADREEIFASHGLTDMRQVLKTAMHLSHESWAWVIDGKPVAAFGIGPKSYVQKHGQPWFIGSDGIGGENSILFLNNSKIIIDYWKYQWDYLENYVYVKNLRAIRWIKFLGFTLYDPKPYGINGRLFHRFDLKGENYV